MNHEIMDMGKLLHFILNLDMDVKTIAKLQTDSFAM